MLRPRSMPAFLMSLVIVIALPLLTSAATAFPLGAVALSSARAMRALTVSGVAPTLMRPPDITIAVGEMADRTLYATDADGDALMFSKASGPTYMTVTTTDPGAGTATGNVHLAPGPSDTGLANAVVGVTDGLFTDQASFQITTLGRSAGYTRTLLKLTRGAPDYGFGSSASSAGDFNGDGYVDLIVGAPFSDADAPLGGRAYIYYGGPIADVQADVTFRAESAGQIFGVSVAGAGDVNGDGYDDVVVGSWRYASETGRAYVYYGGPLPDAVPDLVFTGEAFNSQLGLSVSSAGDFNGDGYPDLLVGAPNIAASRPGRAYIYYGGPHADSAPDIRLSGGEVDDYFGLSVASAGDVNQDGYADVIVGAMYARAAAGNAYIFYGGPAPDNIPDMVMMGQGNFGGSVNSAGDVNGDGCADVIVGGIFAPGGGQARVFYGGSHMDAEADLVLADPAGGYFGGAVASAGDVNGDGCADLVVGASDSDLGGQNAGWVGLFNGGPGADGIADLFIVGETPGGFMGRSVSSVDFDQDGYGDLIIGAPDGSAGLVLVVSTRPTVQHVGLDLDPNVINLKSHAPWLTAYVEPTGFNPTGIDLSTLRLAGLVAAAPKSALVGDHDQDGIPDLMVKFSRRVLDPLLAPGMNELEVTGSLVTGEQFKGSDEVRVIDPPVARLSASVTPNPFNPTGALSFDTLRSGPVRVAIFDVQGRMVRVLMDTAALPMGHHKVPIDVRSERGHALASGLYFFRVEAGEEVAAGRIVIMK